MADLNFPTNPELDETYIANNVIYTWNGEYWEANTTNGFDSRYVEVAGDNMTGDLTLGTDKITLNASDGSASFAGGLDVFNSNGRLNLESNTIPLQIYRQSDVATGSVLQIYTNVGGTKVLQGSWMADGQIQVGGTISSDPNISLNADGSAEFAGGVFKINATGSISVDRPQPDNFLWTGNQNGNNTSGIRANGDATFAGTVQQNVTRTASVEILLEADDDTKYTSTTDADGNETRVYNGATLDVKDRLQNLIARIDAIEANEVTDDATDSALLTLVASLSSRLDERDATIAALTTRISTLEIQSNGGNS